MNDNILKCPCCSNQDEEHIKRTKLFDSSVIVEPLGSVSIFICELCGVLFVKVKNGKIIR